MIERILVITVSNEVAQLLVKSEIVSPTDPALRKPQGVIPGATRPRPHKQFSRTIGRMPREDRIPDSTPEGPILLLSPA